MKWEIKFDNLSTREAFLIGVIIHIHMKGSKKHPKDCVSCNFCQWAMANIGSLVG